MIKLMRVIVQRGAAHHFFEPHRFWSSWLAKVLALLFLCLAGCTATQAQIDRGLATGPDPALRIPSRREAAYTVACPDVLDLEAGGRADLSGRRRVGPDGRIDLGRLGRLRVEGQPADEIARQLARVAGVPEDSFDVRVAEYNSQHVYLAGQSAGLRHVVDYRGPETVVELLRRVGGISPGGAPDEVFLVRNHVGEDKRPEVFRISLRAILLQNDPRSNVVVQPRDEIYIGETRGFSFEKCVPPWLRPVYEAIVGIRAREAAPRAFDPASDNELVSRQ
jgi:protein involved in polysaccharide export with SLBB domain